MPNSTVYITTEYTLNKLGYLTQLTWLEDEKNKQVNWK
jgi:hypothetical protein